MKERNVIVQTIKQVRVGEGDVGRGTRWAWHMRNVASTHKSKTSESAKCECAVDTVTKGIHRTAKFSGVIEDVFIAQQSLM